ncbi:MAG: glycoside hydrolase family 127 protein [Kiritimatiellae bacterium]|nr:glycoside hydrolase family 127 protein [Kiritimatiellia bacterium]
MKKTMVLAVVAAAGAACGALPENAVKDALVAPELKNTRVQGQIGAKFDTFMQERCLSDFARGVVVREAREAFAHPDDDVFQAPVGMWKGEFWGKLMISSARVAQYQDNPAFTAFLRDEAHRLMMFQKPDGYLGTYVNPEFVIPGDPEAARKTMGWACDWCWNLWCRKYTMWGLLMIYKTTGDREILAAADRAMTQQIEMLRRMNVKLCDTGTSAMVGMPSCSVLKPLVMLYRETGKPLFLDYAKEIVSYWDRPGNPAPNFFPNAATGRPLNEWYPDRTGRWGKAYEMMSCLDGVLEYYRLTGEARCLEMVKQMQAILWASERNLVESVGYNDQFVGASRHLNGTSEPCDAIHWIRLNFDLYLITGDKKYVDAIEMTFYNAFLAGVFRDGKWGAREVRSHGRHIARFGQSGMRHQHCCVNNMPRTFMDVAQLGVTREAADGALRVNLYSPSTTTIGDATVVLTGEFPVADRVTAMMEAKTPQTVKFRLPPWSKATVFRRLPDGAETSVASGDWHTVQVPAGVTAITVKFDMTPRLEDSDRAPSDVRTDYRYGRWNVGRDTAQLFRTTPAARLFRGPLLLAKAKAVGDDEADILRADLNKGGWKVKLRPFVDDRVMGAWEATFTRGKEVYKTNVCDFPSAGDSLLPIGANAFSIFF